MESLSPFLWRTCTSYNMPVYPGARRMVGHPEVSYPEVISQLITNRFMVR
jgi:hypothetical protein